MTTFLNINGKSVPLDGEGWETGKFTTVDLLRSFLQSHDSKEFTTYLQSLVLFFYNRLLSGDTLVISTTLITTLFILSIIYPIFSSKKTIPIKTDIPTEEEKTDPRDFTIQQLREFDGTNDKPIYISLKFDVFDVSSAKGYYGQGSGYHCFAGREASRAMAKLCFEENELSSTQLDDLTSFEKGILDDWYNKFKHYRSYPIIGRISLPPNDLQLTKEQLSHYKGTQSIPEGRIHAPIYISINRNIYDVSYGGVDMYGEGCGYHLFAGIDASKSLAKMSFDPIYLGNMDLSDLTPEELKVLSDWETRLSSKYPKVGILID